MEIPWTTGLGNLTKSNFEFIFKSFQIKIIVQEKNTNSLDFFNFKRTEKIKGGFKTMLKLRLLSEAKLHLTNSTCNIVFV